LQQNLGRDSEPPSNPAQDSESSTESANSTDVPGTIDITLSTYPTQRIGSLTFVPNSADQSSYMLDVSNTTVPTPFLLHQENCVPPVSGHPNWTPVSLRVPLNASSATSPAYCAEFQTGPGSSAPVVVKPCVQGWDASATGSQLFVYDTVTSQISPYWSSLLNNTSGSSPSSSTSPAPSGASNGVHSRSSTSNMAPASLHFTPSPPPSSATRAVTSASTQPDEGDADNDDASVSDGSVDEDGADTNSNSSGTSPTPSDMQFENLLANDDTDPSDGVPGTDTSSDPSSPPTAAVPASVPSTVPTPADPTAPCSDGDVTCIGGQFAECASAAWVLTTCGPGTVCRIVPEWDSPGSGMIPTCDTPEDAALRNGGASSR
jgi:hypothetical protein